MTQITDYDTELEEVSTSFTLYMYMCSSGVL